MRDQNDEIAGVDMIRDDLERSLKRWEERLGTVINFTSDFYWEQDTAQRLTFYWGREAGRSDIQGDPLHLLGKGLWEQGGLQAADKACWEEHLTVREARQTFTNFSHSYVHPEQGLRFVSISGEPTFDSEGNYTGYRGIARDVTDSMQAEQMAQLEISILRDISGRENVSDAIQSAIEILCKHQNWEAGSFWALDEQSGVLRHASGWSNKKTAAISKIMEEAGNVVFEQGSGLPGWVWQTGETLWIPDVKNDARVWTTEVTDLTGWNAAFLFPVTLEGKFLGVLDFYAPVIHEPETGLLHVIQIIGAEIGHYYQRATTLQQLRESEARFRSLTELSSDWYWETDSEFRFVRFDGRNKAMVQFLKRSYLGKRSWDSGIGSGNDPDMNPFRLLMGNHEPFSNIVFSRQFEDGRELHVAISGEPILDDDGKFRGYRGVGRDITDARQAEEKIQFLATHDPLTGLPNRAMFSELLNHAIETARRYDRQFVIFFVDLDHFKAVNDTLGHHAGDKLLIEIAGRFTNCLRESDVIARLGGDEFVILAQEISEITQAVTIARNILESAARAVVIQGRECRVTASIGICMYPLHAEEEEMIMKLADRAMYRAKEKGKNNYQLCSDDNTSVPAED